MPATTANVGGALLYRHLQEQIAIAIRRLQGEFIFERGLIPVSGLLQGGEREIVQPEIREFGEASISEMGADDIPMVEISATEANYRVFKAEAGFPITHSEQMAYDFARQNGGVVDPYDIKFTTALNVIRSRIDRFAAFGERTLGVTGLINNPNVADDNQTAENPYDPAMDGYSLRRWMLAPTSKIDTATEDVGGAIARTLLVSSNLYNQLEQTMLVNQGVSVLQSLEATGRRVVKSRRLNASALRDNGVFAAGTTTERFVVMPTDRLTLNRRLKPAALYPEMYPYSKGNRVVYPMYGMTSVTMINYPANMLYVNYNSGE